MAQEQEPKTYNAVVKVEKTPLFSLRDKLIYAFGFIAFILGGPAVMAYLAAWSPVSFLSDQPSTFYLGGFTSAVGLFFALWANYELVIKGRGGAGNFGNIKLMKETKHLVTSGPYSICRNPMHLGVFLYYMGFACALSVISQKNTLPIRPMYRALCLRSSSHGARLRLPSPRWASWC